MFKEPAFYVNARSQTVAEVDDLFSARSFRQFIQWVQWRSQRGRARAPLRNDINIWPIILYT